MKKALSTLLACVLTLSLLACVPAMAATEIVDGRFVETVSITVEVFDRGLDNSKTAPEDNYWTEFIKEGMLRDHNVEVTFIPVDRWSETEQINNLLAAGDAPDVCVTYSFPTIQTYANMGGVVNLDPYLTEYKDLLPNLWNLLTDTNIYWDQDPENGTVWAIEARLADSNRGRINTFVRQDWLDILGLEEPTTLEAFEAVLYAFQDNAELLLGDDADKMIPFSISFDIGWRADHLLTSFVPNDLTDKEAYINGFDDRHLLYPGYKEGVRKLNEWYNAGLIWTDFALYGSGDKTEDNMMKAGYVGSFMHNWDYPYRDGLEGLHGNLQQISEDMAYIAVEPFENDAGAHKKFLANPIDRKVFFPYSNDEPLASLLYLDWVSTLENRMFLQTGEEGLNHEVLEDGTIKAIATQGATIMNSPNNIDYTITINGLDLGDLDASMRALALNYGYVDASYITKAYAATLNDGYVVQNFNVGEIKAQEGMDEALKEKRNAFLAQAIVCSPDQFDAVYDAGMADYLASGGQAIIDERAEAYAKYYE